MNDPKIIVALDYPDASAAQAMVARLDPALCQTVADNGVGPVHSGHVDFRLVEVV